MSLTVEPALLVGFCLALVRATAWTLVCPPFNSPAIPARIKVGFSVSLSFLLARQMADPTIDLGVASFVGQLLLQALGGVALGLLVLMLFSALQAAGELIDLQVGFSLGGVMDPLSGNMAAPIGRFHQLLAVVLLFAVNGHVLVVRGFLRSIEVSPSGALDSAALAEQATRAVATMFAAAIEIALPVLAALFCAEVALGLLGKAAPQLNILMLGFAAKTLIAFVLLGATLAMLPESTESLVMQGLRAGLRVLGA